MIWAVATRRGLDCVIHEKCTTFTQPCLLELFIPASFQYCHIVLPTTVYYHLVPQRSNTYHIGPS